MQAPPENPIQAKPTGKKSQQLLLEKSTQEKPVAAQPPTQQPKQAEARGTQPQKSSSQHTPAEQSAQSTSKSKQSPMPPPPRPPVKNNDHTRKQADGPPPKQPVQENSKGSQVEQPLQVNAKGKQPEQPRLQQSVQPDRKGKTVEQAAQPNLKRKQDHLSSNEQLNVFTAGGKEPQTSSFQQFLQGKYNLQSPPQQIAQAEPKGKQVEQPEQANLSLRSKQPQQAPPEQSKQPTAKGQRSLKAPVEEYWPGWPPKRGILANARPVYLGCPKVYITRIPYSRNGKPKAMHRVKVYVKPDVAGHPQTFFFKNIPDVEWYWGFCNDPATTAQRIVRLEKEGQPTPYFLLACRGEWPELTSPRNDNAIFAGLHELMVFSDAFVFKLGEPETYGEGYVNYVHIEEDLGSVGWIPNAIREAAEKVEYATPVNANPGFPDMEKYADPETISKDIQKMLKHMNKYKKTAERRSSAPPLEHKLDGGGMKSTIMEVTALLHVLRTDVFPPIDGAFKLSDDQDRDCIVEADAAFKAIRDHDLNDDTSSTSTTEADQTTNLLLRQIQVTYYDFIRKATHAHELLTGDGTNSEEDTRAMKEAYDASVALKTKVRDAFRNEIVIQKVSAPSWMV